MNQHAQLLSDHRTRILDAAQTCFVRSGFHRATMQDVATEAGMSAGNIYRYFASKDAIISGLCARDRADLARAFEHLQTAPDPFAIFMAIGQQHLVEEPRGKAVFVLDLWAESARNPKIADICRDFETDIQGLIGGFILRLVADGEADQRLNVPHLVEFLLCMADGLLARRAREPDFNPACHMAHINDVLRLACAGQLPSMLIEGQTGQGDQP